MNDRLDEIMDTFSEEEVELLVSQIPIEIDSDPQLRNRISAKVLDKAGLAKKKRSRPKVKNMRLLLVAALLLLMATGAGYYVGVGEFLKGIFMESENLSLKQMQIIEDIGYYVDVPPVTSQGYTLQAVAAVSDQNSAYVVFEFEALDSSVALADSSLYFSTQLLNYDESIPRQEYIYLGNYLYEIESSGEGKLRFVLYIENSHPEIDLVGKTIEIYLANLYQLDDVYGQIPLAYGPWEFAVTIQPQDQDQGQTGAIFAEYSMAHDLMVNDTEITITHMWFSPLRYTISGIETIRADEGAADYLKAISIALYDKDRNLIIELEEPGYRRSIYSEDNMAHIQLNGLFSVPVSHKDIHYAIINGVEIELK